MELSLHHRRCMLRLRSMEAMSLSNMFWQLDLVLENFEQQMSAPSDPLFAQLDLGGFEQEPTDPLLTLLFPSASDDESYAKFMRLTQQRRLLLQHRSDIAELQESLNQVLFSDERLAADVDQLRGAAFQQLQHDLQHPLPEQTRLEAEPAEGFSGALDFDAAQLAENFEFAQALQEIFSSGGEVDLDNPDLEADRQLKQQLVDLIERTHPFVLELEPLQAARWARICALVRLSIASRIVGETGLSPQQAAEVRELPEDYLAMYDWMSLLVDGLSSAALLLLEDD